TPPAAAVTAFSVAAMPVTSDISFARDLALVTVNADWSANVQGRGGLYIADPAGLAGKQTFSYGYGINVDDPNCFDNASSTTGAGVARFGGTFKILSGQRVGGAGSYDLENSDFVGQKVICGDSGGPDIMPLGPPSNVWYHLLGVHSLGTSILSNTVPSLWFQTQLGGLFVTSHDLPSQHLPTARTLLAL